MFYYKFIKIEAIVEELDGLNLSKLEKRHLASLLDSSLQHTILDQILANLNEEDKKLFLQLLMKNEQDDQVLDFLNKRIENMENKISKIADDLVQEMHKDIKTLQAKRYL